MKKSLLIRKVFLLGLTLRLKRKALSILVIIMMTMTMLTSTAFAASPSDISNHWAKAQIEDWMNKGLVNGYPDTTFRPDNNITRAEFMVLVNGAFGYSKKASIDYTDVTTSDWYADAVAKAKAAGYIAGYADGTVKPSNPISREEAAVVIMKVKQLTQNQTAADKFTDATRISGWSKGGIGAVVTAGIMSGYPDGTFKADTAITRAEAVAALGKALANIIPVTPVDQSITYDKAGIYGPATGTEIVKGNVTIKAQDITLQNTVIEGNLTIDKAVGEGNATFKSVIVKGNTYVYGGGTNSVYFIDTQTGKTYVLKDSGPVRIVISGTSEVSQLIAQSSVKVQEVDLTGKGFEGIVADRQVDGTITVNLAGMNVESIEVNSTNTIIVTDRNTNISSFVANAAVDVTGAGTISNATINASGVIYDTKFTSQTVASGVSAPVKKPSTSDGGSGSFTVLVSDITVTGADNATTVANGGTLLMSAVVTPSNAANRTIAWSVATLAGGTAAIDSITGLLTATGNGTVRVTATNAASGVVGTKDITVQAAQATPTFSPGAGAVAFGTTVTITSAGADAIYYTTNGDVPTTASTKQVDTPLIINAAVTVRALAVKEGNTNSAIASAAYTQAMATVPSNIELEIGGTHPVGGVTNVTIPAVGTTNASGAVTGWVTGTNDKIKFTVTDAGGTSAITINTDAYTNGTDYQIANTSGLTIVVTTTELGKVTAVRTFTLTVAPRFIMVGVGASGTNYTIPTGTDDLGAPATVTGGYLMSETETTYELWYAVRQWAEANGYVFCSQGREGNDGTNGAAPTAAKLEPVTSISWIDILVWLNALSEMNGLSPVYRTTVDHSVFKDSNQDIDIVALIDAGEMVTNNGYRLPTSMEWEMAASWIDGTVWIPGNYASGATADYTDAVATQAVAWYSANANGSTQPVGGKIANALGLKDMSGNVWEYGFGSMGLGRQVLRGGSWRSVVATLQVGHEDNFALSNLSDMIGFRIVK